jgi:F-type H+-transporting ATPase subunit gamma
MGLNAPLHRAGPQGILLITSDLGLCGDYNMRLSANPDESFASENGVRIYVVGRRGKRMLQKQAIDFDRAYSAPASVDGLPERLLQVAEDVIGDYSRGEIAGLDVLSARFAGAGKFSRERTSILPLKPSAGALQDTTPPVASWQRYQSRERLLATIIREYLYITLYQLLLDALASEHGMRLIAAESARQWIEETEQTVHRQLSMVRRENSTQEVLDIVSASRKKSRTGSGRCE